MNIEFIFDSVPSAWVVVRLSNIYIYTYFSKHITYVFQSHGCLQHRSSHTILETYKPMSLRCLATWSYIQIKMAALSHKIKCWMLQLWMNKPHHTWWYFSITFKVGIHRETMWMKHWGNYRNFTLTSVKKNEENIYRSDIALGYQKQIT